ncbi:hypothetical protein KIL84_014602 [Mauremys mutica]|uniref:Uncharacterized protein n=1 Tax=Mauremys mutica TaxID=74926 RepID=A0A9D3XQ01_9SAUR|nr:hypothetical protein KIL84_014602 [Mauremys mutica]
MGVNINKVTPCRSRTINKSRRGHGQEPPFAERLQSPPAAPLSPANVSQLQPQYIRRTKLSRAQNPQVKMELCKMVCVCVWGEINTFTLWYVITFNFFQSKMHPNTSERKGRYYYPHSTETRRLGWKFSLLPTSSGFLGGQIPCSALKISAPVSKGHGGAGGLEVGGRDPRLPGLVT